MEYLVNAEEMRRCDQGTIKKYGVESLVLMERAALTVVEELCNGSFDLNRVLVVCGSGNNGGDGFAIARLLYLKNIDTAVVFAGKEESLTEETKIQKKICENYGMNIFKKTDMHEYTCIVDAVFGVGLSREIKGEYACLIQQINASGARVVAVDIPSGVSADTGKVMGTAVRADETVTFAYQKIGQALYPGSQMCGRLCVRDIGITAHGFGRDVPLTYSLTEEDMGVLPVRQAYSNKGTYGKALLVAGQKNMCGAAILAARAAYRAGTGLVRVMTEECNRTAVQVALPEALLSTYDPMNFQPDLDGMRSWPTAVGIGPGIGMSGEKREILELLLRESRVPVVMDADALNLLAREKELLQKRSCQVIVTPHVGEMCRLTGRTKQEITGDLIGTCRSFARENGVICVLKDARTVISDGREVCINQTGCSGMATGGSGDVLTGLLTGLLAQGMEPFLAAKSAVYLHGKAGELAESRMGARGMLAGDIACALPEILDKYRACAKLQESGAGRRRR